MTQYFTKEGLQKLKDELHYLKTTKNKEIIDLISEAAAFGDLKENASYHEARDKMAFLRMRIQELEGAINEAVVKPACRQAGKKTIDVGSQVKILFDGQEAEYEIVGPAEANILKNKLSYQSPLGQKLLGKKIGEEFDYGVPPGSGPKKVKVKILEIK